MPNRKIILIMLVYSPLVLIVSLFFYERIIYFIEQQKPIPPYQRVVLPSPPSLCEKIENKELQRLCLAKIQDPNTEIDWQSLWHHNIPSLGLGPEGGAFYGGLSFVEEYFSESKTAESLSDYCKKKESASPILQTYCKAVLINPHYCLKTGLGFSIIGHLMFRDSPQTEECYQDIAVIWQDPFLCEKSRDRDYCHLRLVARSVGLNLDK